MPVLGWPKQDTGLWRLSAARSIARSRSLDPYLMQLQLRQRDRHA